MFFESITMLFGGGERNTRKKKKKKKKTNYLVTKSDSLIVKKWLTITTSDLLGFIPKEHR